MDECVKHKEYNMNWFADFELADDYISIDGSHVKAKKANVLEYYDFLNADDKVRDVKNIDEDYQIGYLVCTQSGYVTWESKRSFEKKYSKLEKKEGKANGQFYNFKLSR